MTTCMYMYDIDGDQYGNMNQYVRNELGYEGQNLGGKGGSVKSFS